MEEDESGNKDEAMQVISQYRDLPRLVVFDLDYTLWPCHWEQDELDLYPEASGILHALKEKGIDVAIASKRRSPKVANAFLQKLGIDSLFLAKEIYRSSSHKTQHFRRIHTKTGVPLTSMLFFDDKERNIQAVLKMGVTCILVGNGMNIEALKQGLKEFSQKVA